MTHSLLWGLFILSASLLIVILLRSKHSVQWLAYVGLNIVLASVLLYAINWFGLRSGFHIPINVTTVSTVGLLGVPGILLLAALKVTLFGIGS